jgi:hypothetical protein
MFGSNLPTNIGLGWYILTMTNTTVYYETGQKVNLKKLSRLLLFCKDEHFKKILLVFRLWLSVE